VAEIKRRHFTFDIEQRYFNNKKQIKQVAVCKKKRKCWLVLPKHMIPD